MTLEELQTFYNSIYPDSTIKLNNEDWAICNVDIENNSSKNVCDYLEKVNNRVDISKTSSLQISELFINKLLKELQPYNKEITGTIEPFCDNQEQGLMLSLTNKSADGKLYIWACEDITDKSLMIITSTEKTKQNLYMQHDLEKAQYFTNYNFSESISYVISKIDKFLNEDLNMKI